MNLQLLTFLELLEAQASEMASGSYELNPKFPKTVA